MELTIDANYIFAPVEALILSRAVEDCDITWFEEPAGLGMEVNRDALRDSRIDG